VQEPAVRISVGSCTLAARPAEPGGLGVSPNVPGPESSPEYFRQTVEVLLKRADDALYRAKRRGGMRVCSSRASMWGNDVPDPP
jgi:hypothetical protein